MGWDLTLLEEQYKHSLKSTIETMFNKPLQFPLAKVGTFSIKRGYTPLVGTVTTGVRAGFGRRVNGEEHTSFQAKQYPTPMLPTPKEYP